MRDDIEIEVDDFVVQRQFWLSNKWTSETALVYRVLWRYVNFK